jgi:hypothetical protein
MGRILPRRDSGDFFGFIGNGKKEKTPGFKDFRDFRDSILSLGIP